MIIGILDGLEHLHTRKIIHRDLKPGNVLLQGRIPRLSDFGISRVMAIDSNSNTKSGTYWYMSPEAHQGKRNVQTDIWSIGVILFQLLKGDLPFPQKTLPELLAAVTRGEAESLPDCIPVELKDILSKAIAVDLAARYQTAKEMSQALKDISPDYSEAKTISDETITEVITVNEITETATPNPQSDSQERRLIPYRKEDRWGFCDENKNIVLGLKYDKADSFSEGLAHVELNGKHGFIDKCDGAYYLIEGLICIELGDKRGYVDRTGQEIISIKYDDARPFLNGLARVKINGKEGYIGSDGTEYFKD